MDAERLIRDYLARLETAAAPLSAGRRDDLVGEVRGHIELALAEAGRADEATVRNVLDRLGSPEAIVEAEQPTEARAWATPATRPGALADTLGAVEIIALLLLTLGSLMMPIVGPLLGLLFVWASRRWTRDEKLIASAIVLVLLSVPIGLLFAVRIA